MRKLPVWLFGGFFALAGLVAHASEASTADQIRATAVPASQEPLHIVRYDAEPFMIYTNDVMPGIWTRHHQHHNDLLAVIAGATQVGDFRFYTDFNQPQQSRPATIKNNGSNNVRLVVFVAC